MKLQIFLQDPTILPFPPRTVTANAAADKKDLAAKQVQKNAAELDKFLDTHQSNTYEEDLTAFFHDLRKVVGMAVPITMDLSSPPIRYFRNTKTNKVIAWYDDTENLGYRPKS